MYYTNFKILIEGSLYRHSSMHAMKLLISYRIELANEQVHRMRNFSANKQIENLKTK